MTEEEIQDRSKFMFPERTETAETKGTSWWFGEEEMIMKTMVKKRKRRWTQGADDKEENSKGADDICFDCLVIQSYCFIY